MAKEYIERNALIAEYDRVHIGAPGGARRLMVDAPTADVVEVEKVAKILTDVTGIAPCEMVGANEWDYDYCNCAELCSQSNYKQCWEQYLKHLKR